MKNKLFWKRWFDHSGRVSQYGMWHAYRTRFDDVPVCNRVVARPCTWQITFPDDGRVCKRCKLTAVMES